jgi:hypothetical protein
VSEPSWKVGERDVADFFGTNRTPLSGGSSRHTRSDTLHPTLFVEVKYRKKHAVIGLWDETAKLAAKEKKTPVVCLKERGRPGFWILVRSTDLPELTQASSTAGPSSSTSPPSPSSGSGFDGEGLA